MEWTDIRENDILEYNPEFLQAYEEMRGRKFHESYSNVKPYIDKFFVVSRFDSKDSMNRSWSLRFKRSENGGNAPPSHGIMPKTGAFFEFPEGPPVFRIVSLAGDE
jgi:hypothetical protein